MTYEELQHACGIGDGSACEALRLTLYSAAQFTFSDIDTETEHPNRMPFSGTLLLVNEASDKPPHGSRGHRIYVPKGAVKKNLAGLIGQGVNYAPGGMDGHEPRHKVGVITNASLDGNRVQVEGFVYAKDFPEAAKDFKKPGLGMSMELSDVYVRDENEPVWHLQDFAFTGATILRKDAAAYSKTSLAASREAARGTKGESMAEKKEKTQEKPVKVAASAGEKVDDMAAAIATAVKAGNEELVQAISTTNNSIAELRDYLTIQAAGNAQAEEEEDVDAAAELEAEDEEEVEEEEEMEAMEDLEEDAPEEEPGEVGSKKGGENKGSKKTVTDPPKQGGGGISEGRLASAARPFPKFPKVKGGAAIAAAAVKIDALSSQVRRLESKLKIEAAARTKLKNKYDRVAAQVSRYAEAVDRRSAALPAELINLAAKSNIDLAAMHSTGTKFSVEQFDAMVRASAIDIDPTSRAAMKNRAVELGLMEQGEIRRPWNN